SGHQPAPHRVGSPSFEHFGFVVPDPRGKMAPKITHPDGGNTMKEFFGEKSLQIEPAALEAFGVPIDSRYGQARELIELINSANLLTEKRVPHSVNRALYDSKACMCTLELEPSVQQGDAVADAILEAATETIRQFDWFDTVQHGKPLSDIYAGSTDE